MTLSPKHLSFDEMWKLYRHIEKSLPEKEQEFLLHEVIEILKAMSKNDFIAVLNLLCGDGFQTRITTAEYGLVLVKGIKKNNLFSFVDFIKGLKNDPA